MALISRLKQWWNPASPTPVFVPDAAEAPDRRVKERRNAAPGTRVLIIDDSATIVALLRRMLRQNELATLEAGDAEAGIVLPGMNGFAALRNLRTEPTTRDIPVIMISGNEQATEQFYAHRIGADDFMKKPFSRAEVFARIERLLDPDRIPRRIPVATGESETA